MIETDLNKPRLIISYIRKNWHLLMIDVKSSGICLCLEIIICLYNISFAVFHSLLLCEFNYHTCALYELIAQL